MYGLPGSLGKEKFKKEMIRAVAFDLDGVLIDSKDLHYEALNKAIDKVAGKAWMLSKEEHYRAYDGLPTKTKLSMLHQRKGLPKKFFHKIWLYKQKETARMLSKLPREACIRKIFSYLSCQGLKIFVATNSTRKTALQVVRRLNLLPYRIKVISSEDVRESKPHPEIYLRCMVEASCRPDELLVVEDSPSGIQSAADSGAKYIVLKKPSDLTFKRIRQELEQNKKTPKRRLSMGGGLNILIPMAGEGKRFQEAGYSFPKPLIEVPNMNGNPMIKVVVDSLGIHGKTIFVVQTGHRHKFNLDSFLGMLAPECKIVEVEGVTEGAACTCLLAKAHINNGDELVVANSDQFLDWKPEQFIYFMRNKKADFGILTFPNNHPKWSYAKTDADGKVSEVAEKKVISNHATVGVYYWKKGADFIRSAERMIKKNLRVGQSFNGKGEFYVCPSFNEMIREGKSGYIFEIKKSQMYGLGTPEDLRYFVDHYERLAV